MADFRVEGGKLQDKPRIFRDRRQESAKDWWDMSKEHRSHLEEALIGQTLNQA